MPLVSAERGRDAWVATFSGLYLMPALCVALLRVSGTDMFPAVESLGLEAKLISRFMQSITLIVLLILDRRLAYGEHGVVNLMRVSSIGLGIFTLGYYLAPGQLLPLLTGGACGIFKTVLLLGCGYLLCSIEPRSSAFALTLGFAIGAIVQWVVGYLPPSALAAFNVIVPFAFLGCFIPGVNELRPCSIPDPIINRTSFKSLPLVIIVFMAACTLTSVFVHWLIPTHMVEDGGVFPTAQIFIMTAIFICHLVWLVLLGKSNPDYLWPVLIVIILGGLICYSSLVGTYPSFAAECLVSTQTCVLLLCWLLVSNITYRCHLPRVFTFGLGTLIFGEPITLAICLSDMVNPQAYATAGELHVILTVVGLTLLLVIMTVALLVLNITHKAPSSTPADAHSGDAAANQLIAPQPSFDPAVAAIEELALEYGLTSREVEVALNLSHGYTLPMTAQALHLSLDTVRTHVKCLYRKLGIHKKIELIELIEGHTRQ